MKDNTDNQIDIPEIVYVLANEHRSLNSSTSYFVFTEECNKYNLDPAEVLEMVIKEQEHAS